MSQLEWQQIILTGWACSPLFVFKLLDLYWKQVERKREREEEGE